MGVPEGAVADRAEPVMRSLHRLRQDGPVKPMEVRYYDEVFVTRA
jgi:hypothetical protein